MYLPLVRPVLAVCALVVFLRALAVEFLVAVVDVAGVEHQILNYSFILYTFSS